MWQREARSTRPPPRIASTLAGGATVAAFSDAPLSHLAMNTATLDAAYLRLISQNMTKCIYRKAQIS
jgi:hypothetical protein